MAADTHAQPPGWNAGGWYGSQLGGTLWLAVSAGVLAARSPAVAGMVFALFLIANGIGIVLWRRRSKMTMASAMQFLLATLWVCSMVAIFVVDRAGLWETLRIGGGTNMPASWAYVLLTALVLALGAMCHGWRRKQSQALRGVG